MDRHERAEIAVRLVGLAALVRGGAVFIFAIVYTALVASRVSRGGLWVVTEDFGPIVETLLGVGLLAGAGAVAELLVPARAEFEQPAVAEMFGLGTFALAVYFLIGALVYLLVVGAGTVQTLIALGGSWKNALVMGPAAQPWAFYRPYAIRAAAGGLAAAVLLVGGQALARGVMTRRWAGQGFSLAGALGTGFALMAILTAGRTAVSYLYERAWPAFRSLQSGTLAPPGTSPTWFNVTAALQAVQGMLLLALCVPAGRWLARGAPEGRRPVLPALRKEGWTAAALSGLTLWGALLVMVWLRGLGQIGLARPLGPAAQWTVAGAAPVLALAAMLVAGRWGASVAHGEAEGEDGAPADRGAALVAVEVAVTLAALYRLLEPGWGLERALYWPLPVLLTIGLALVLRGDVARWCVRGAAEDAGEMRERRRAALYPALSFLGWVMALDGARLALMAALVWGGALTPAQHLPGVPVRSSIGLLTYVQFAGALVLLLARRPLCRLLAYGPLLHRRGRGAPAAG